MRVEHLGSDDDVPCAALPYVDYLVRNAKYARPRARPDDPRDLEFELELEQLPEGFFKGDLEV